MGKNKNKKKLSIQRMRAARKAQLESARQSSSEDLGAAGDGPKDRGRSLGRKGTGKMRCRSKSAPPAPTWRETIDPDDPSSRYWRLVLGDLRKSLDELYVGCKTQGDVVHSKEVLAQLDHSRQEFANLIDSFAYNAADDVPPVPTNSLISVISVNSDDTNAN